MTHPALISVSFLALASCSAAPQAPVLEAATAAICYDESVRVTDADTGEPITGAWVVIGFDEDAPGRREMSVGALTDSHGRVTVRRDHKERPRWVNVAAPGYDALVQTRILRAGGAGRQVVFEMPAFMVQLKPSPTVLYWGRLDGGAQGVLIRSDASNEHVTGLRAWHSVVACSDANGVFVFPVNHLVALPPHKFSLPGTRNPLEPGSMERPNTIGHEVDINGYVDVLFEQRALSRIAVHGRLHQHEGDLEETTVHLAGQSMKIAPDGTFAFWGLQPGSYDLHVLLSNVLEGGSSFELGDATVDLGEIIACDGRCEGDTSR